MTNKRPDQGNALCDLGLLIVCSATALFLAAAEISAHRSAGYLPEARTPRSEVEGVLVHHGGHLLLIGQLLGKDGGTIIRPCRLVTEIDALTAGRIGINIDHG